MSASENPQNLLSLDFSGLILGFSSAALYYIGENTVEGKRLGEKNLPLAKQNIDIVKLLREKTQGNLTADEAKLIEEIYSDLNEKYEKAAKDQ